MGGTTDACSRRVSQCLPRVATHSRCCWPVLQVLPWLAAQSNTRTCSLNFGSFLGWALGARSGDPLATGQQCAARLTAKRLKQQCSTAMTMANSSLAAQSPEKECGGKANTVTSHKGVDSGVRERKDSRVQVQQQFSSGHTSSVPLHAMKHETGAIAALREGPKKALHLQHWGTLTQTASFFPPPHSMLAPLTPTLEVILPLCSCNSFPKTNA